MKKSFQKPTGKEKLTPRGWYDKWHAFMYGDALAKQGVKYTRVFLDDLEKMKKNSKIKKILNKKCDNTPLNVSTMQGDDKPSDGGNRDIHIGGQVGMPEEIQHKITFADFRKQSREIMHGRNSI